MEYKESGAQILQPPENFPWACEMKVGDPDGRVLRFGSDPKKETSFIDSGSSRFWGESRTFHEDFPFVLVAFMSLHSLFTVLLLTPALRRLGAERRLGALTLGHWGGLLLGIFLGFLYVNLVIDQLACFLGVPNCD
jgi:hypothetical protein